MNKKAGLGLSILIMIVIFIAGFVLGFLKSPTTSSNNIDLEQEIETLKETIENRDARIQELENAFDNPNPANKESICLTSGGAWTEFSNGCGDSCGKERDPTTICTLAFAFNCDCGPLECWNGQTCEPN